MRWLSYVIREQVPSLHLFTVLSMGLCPHGTKMASALTFLAGRGHTGQRPSHSTDVSFIFVVIRLFILDDLVDVTLKPFGSDRPIYGLLDRYLKYLLLRSAHKQRLYTSLLNISCHVCSDYSIMPAFTSLSRELETKICLGWKGLVCSVEWWGSSVVWIWELWAGVKQSWYSASTHWCQS